MEEAGREEQGSHAEVRFVQVCPWAHVHHSLRHSTEQ